MSSAMNHKARSHRSYAAHQSACGSHSRRVIIRQTNQKKPGLLSRMSVAFKSRSREQKVDAV